MEYLRNLDLKKNSMISGFMLMLSFEILYALDALTKKLEAAEMKMRIKLLQNGTPNICEVGVGGEKTKAGGGVYFVVNDKAIVDSGVPRQDVVPAAYVVVEADDTLGRVCKYRNEHTSGVFVEGVRIVDLLISL
ncbi:hypothetical protein HAX54_007964 [Datura stramonium]|uniref:Uncharacterized protein n=1 Tax=Datura stramonium TaxID=4076 RepID=A0ABS8RV47_DATST|nr:hypothetical protein [Datura stramonium]